MPDDRDDFWDLAALLPPKKKVRVEPPVTRPYTVELTLPAQPAPPPAAQPFAVTAPAEEPVLSYAPPDNPFLVSVEITKRAGSFGFYRQFRADAIRLLHEGAAEVPYVQFFSYIPQYAQLTPLQLAYYLWWRQQLHAGVPLRCDDSYFRLYVYEILNLPDHIPPEEGVRRLCRAWRAYREALPKIDKYMTVWLADYCLVHRLPCPLAEIRSFLPAIMEHAGFREFYLGSASQLNEDGVAALLAATSDYDWQKSRFLQNTPDRETLSRHLFAAMIPVFRQWFARGECVFSGEKLAVLSRDAFSGSLCAHIVKCHITVRYQSFSHSTRLRASVTGALKHAENRLRAMHGQKSRLSADAAEEDRALINAYFDSLPASENPQKAAAEPPTYYRFYEPPAEPVSLADADRIEYLSWGNTRRLVSDAEPVEPVPPPPQPPAEQGRLDGTLRTYLSHLARAEYGLAAATLSEADMLEDRAADLVNECFAEHFGDIILEPTGQGYRIIEDYKDEVTEWLQKI
ncbi:MAG: TerB N-terminal domain-containing protein [Eubacteriales bacterium]